MKSFCVRYHKLFVLFLVVQIALLIAGCGPLNWLTDAQNILPLVAQMASLILTLIASLTGGTIIPVDIAAAVSTIISEILTGIKDIEAAVEEYKSAQTTTNLDKVKAAAQAVIDHIDGFLSDTLPTIVNPALRQKIDDMVTLILKDVVAFASLIPALQAKAGQRLSVTVPMTSKESKAAWNEIVTSPSGDPAVDAALAALPKL